MRILVLLLLAALLPSRGSAPARRSLEALRKEPPFGVPPGIAKEWDRQLDTTYRLYAERRYQNVLEGVAKPLEWAHRFKPNRLSFRTFTFAAGAHIGLLDYPRALAALFEVGRQCRQIEDSECTAAVETNLSSLYFKVRAMPEALDAADEALAVRANLRSSEDRLRMLIHKARLLSRDGHDLLSEKLFRDVAISSEQEGSPRVTADTWAAAGLERTFRDDLDGAEHYLRHSLRLRWTTRDPALPVSLRDLGLLRLRQHDVSAALAFSAHPGVERLAPDWTVAQMRARAYETMGDHRRAMDEFREALNLVSKFRLDLVPAALRASAADRNRELYDEFIAAGWKLHRQSPDPALVGEMLAAAASSQALSLRHTMPAPSAAPGYWSALSELQSSYASVMENSRPHGRGLPRLRRRLIEIQAAGGVAGPPSSWQADAADVQSWQKRIGNVALLVYHLSTPSSFLWTVTSSSVEMCQLQGRREFEPLVRAFVREIHDGVTAGPGARDLGRAAFGCLSSRVLASPNWLVVPDGVLFEAPFSALPVASRGSTGLLVERYSIRVLPGTWMFEEPPLPAWTGPLLGIADPIYNEADPRIRRSILAPALRPELPRLPGTSAEVQRCARVLGVGDKLLTGENVTAERIGEAFGLRPSIIHIATHVLPSPVETREGLIALSASSRGSLEFLSTEWIAAQELHPNLVVMSACRSGGGTIRPGDGLMGLTRAWLQAGARNVVATYWPTPDDSGALLESFYRNLRETPALGQEEALRRAQLAALRAGGWQAKPSFWAGFFVIGRPPS
jgi:tetratricopeptide (TPR) repeat protein